MTQRSSTTTRYGPNSARQLLLTAVGTATLLGIVVPLSVGHAATGGGADARAVLLIGSAQSSSADKPTRTNVGTSLVNAPTAPGAHSTSTDADVEDPTTKTSLVTSSTSASATNDTDSYSAVSTVHDARLVVSGTPVFTARILTASARCPAASASTTHLSLAEITVGGTSVSPPNVPGFSKRIPLGANGDATLMLSQLSSTGAQGAAAEALVAHLSINDGNNHSAEVTSVIASATCQTPAGQLAPTVTALTPTHGPVDGGTVVTLTGTGLETATGVTICGTTVDSIDPSADGTMLTFTTPACEAGDEAVAVTFPDGGPQRAPSDFTYESGAAEPSGTQSDQATISGLDPSQGSTEGGTTVTVNGDHLASATGVGICDATITDLEVAGDGSSVTFVTPPCDSGDQPVTVTFGDASSIASPDAFTYIATAAGAETAADTARITGLSPTSGTAAGGTTLSMTGTGLYDARTVVLCGVTVSGIDVAPDGTRITLTTPPCDSGPRIATVTFGDGSRRGAPQAYTYRGPASAESGAGSAGGKSSDGQSSSGAGSGSTGLATGNLPHTGAAITPLACAGTLALVVGLCLMRWRRRPGAMAPQRGS